MSVALGIFLRIMQYPKFQLERAVSIFLLLIRDLSWVFEMFSGARPSKSSKHSRIELRFA